MYNDHPWNPKIVAVVDRRSLFRGRSCNKTPKWDLKMSVVKDKGVTIHQHFMNSFLYESVFQNFSLPTIWLCNFWAKNIGTKAASKMMVKSG